MSKELEALEKVIQWEADMIDFSNISDEKLDEIILMQRMMKQALKRNEPMKIKKKWDIANKKHYFKCPNCDKEIGRYNKYCTYCGQALDWLDS